MARQVRTAVECQPARRRSSYPEHLHDAADRNARAGRSGRSLHPDAVLPSRPLRAGHGRGCAGLPALPSGSGRATLATRTTLSGRSCLRGWCAGCALRSRRPRRAALTRLAGLAIGTTLATRTGWAGWPLIAAWASCAGYPVGAVTPGRSGWADDVPGIGLDFVGGHDAASFPCPR